MNQKFLLSGLIRQPKWYNGLPLSDRLCLSGVDNRLDNGAIDDLRMRRSNGYVYARTYK